MFNFKENAKKRKILKELESGRNIFVQLTSESARNHYLSDQIYYKVRYVDTTEKRTVVVISGKGDKYIYLNEIALVK